MGIKPVVHYVPTFTDVITVGFPAWVHPVDHHSPLVSNERMCRTSMVIAIGEEGEFETNNTKYEPVGQEWYDNARESGA